MRNSFVLLALFALAGCGGGGSTPAVASDAPVLYAPGTANVVANPLAFAAGASAQFEPQETGGYLGSFSIQATSGTSGAACITTTPSTVSNGQAFTSALTGGSTCSSYPQSETYTVSDIYGHTSSITIQINAP